MTWSDADKKKCPECDLVTLPGPLARHQKASNHGTLEQSSYSQYKQNHLNVKKIRGKASEYLCESCCGGSADEWATIHGLTGDDADHYVPLCFKCHKQYDAKPLPATRRSAISEGMKSKPRTAKQEAQLKRLLAKLHSDGEIYTCRYCGDGLFTLGRLAAHRRWNCI